MALRSEDRVMTVVLVLIGGLTLMLALFNIRHTIGQSYFGEIGQVKGLFTNTQVQQLFELRTKDTDSDGLNDYDELYVYNTSPYLADTDSDDFSDKQEVDSGHNPNCIGDTCIQPRTETAGAPTTTPSIMAPTGVLPSPESLTPDQLRSFLAEAGVSQDLLDQTDDATLMELYRQTVAELEAGTALTNVNPAFSDLLVNAGPTLPSAEEVTDLSPDEVRKLLIDNGFDEELLNQVSDEQLMQVYQESLQELNTNAEQ